MQKQMKGNDRDVRDGGLMRCCILTLSQCEEETEVGSVVACAYEGSNATRMIVAADGVWEWDRHSGEAALV